MMPFSLETLSADDVQAYVEARVQEGVQLDYKGRDYPKDLEKTVAALSNTEGGLIVLGVEEEQTIPTKIVGIPVLPATQQRGALERGPPSQQARQLHAHRATQGRPTSPARQTGNLAGPEQRILDALAWLESIGVETPEHSAVAFLAGYTVGGGAFNNPRGRLRGLGLVEYVAGERI
jgi:hypothetical protein